MSVVDLTNREERRLRIVVVDDILETVAHLRKLLDLESDLEVVGTAATADEAIGLVGQLKPDVVLLDIMMPGTDGITGCARIKALGLETRVVMMSIQGDASYLRRALAAGADEYLVKPFSADELVATVRGGDATENWVRGWRPSEETSVPVAPVEPTSPRPVPRPSATEPASDPQSGSKPKRDLPWRWLGVAGAVLLGWSLLTSGSGGAAGTRSGAICRDGWQSSATGSGACSHHGGVDHWLIR